MKRDFKLFIDRPNSRKLITKYSTDSDIGLVNLFSTFDETISFQEHDQITLTFSVVKNINSIVQGTSIVQQNEILHLLHIGTKLTLIEDSGTEYSFIIASIQPDLKKNNACYSFTCQDEVSYRWSRIKLGYSYSTIERGGPRSLYTIAQDILDDCYLSGWDVVVSNELSTALTPLSKQLITFEIVDSNPYNAIIEACSSANAQLGVNYRNKTITFYQKNNRPFSGYRYRPELNLSSLGASYSGENMATILHVTGGTNEHEINVSLVPYMPMIMQKCFLQDQTKSWEEETSHKWWYSDKLFPIYWRHVLNMNELDHYLGKELENDIANNKMPNDFHKTYNEYKKYIHNTYTTPDAYNQYITQAQIKYADFYLINQYTAQTITKLDDLPEEYQKLYTVDQYNTYIREQQEIEKKELQDFVQVANTQVHLGQFLYNFDFFKNSGLMSIDMYNHIHSIFNKQMRNNNIWLKIYTQHYYELVWQLNQRLTDLRGSLEQANALYSAIYEKWQASLNDTTINIAGLYTEYMAKANSHIIQAEDIISDEKFIALFHTIYGNYLASDIPEFNNLLKEMQAHAKIRDESLIQSSALFAQLTAITDKTSPEYIQIESEYQYYRSRYLTALTLCGNANNGYWTIYSDNKTEYQVPSLYQFIKDNLIDNYSPQFNTAGVYQRIQDYEQNNHQLWKTIYGQYGQFIYEQNYENTDELDSLSLYNQSIAYYEDYNKPSASYTAEVLDLGALESVALPRLKVGYCIKVYNDYLNLNDDALNNIQFTNNELIITSIDYDLRKPQKASIGVEQVTQYQTILQKLIKTVK